MASSSSDSVDALSDNVLDWLPDELLGLVIARVHVSTLGVLLQVDARCSRLVRHRYRAFAAPLVALPQQAFKGYDTAKPLHANMLMTTKLHLANRAIDNVKLALLAAATSAGALPLLTDLDLSYNTIGDPGAASLAETLSDGALTRLVHLHLTGNKIDDKGFDAIATALGNGALRRLRSLYLGCNILGDDAVIALATVLRDGALPSLKTLTLQNNAHIGDRGAKELAANRLELSWLNLGGTMVSEPLRLECHRALASLAH